MFINNIVSIVFFSRYFTTKKIGDMSLSQTDLNRLGNSTEGWGKFSEVPPDPDDVDLINRVMNFYNGELSGFNPFCDPFCDPGLNKQMCKMVHEANDSHKG